MPTERSIQQYLEANFRAVRGHAPQKKHDYVIGIVDDEESIVRGLKWGFEYRGFDTVAFYVDRMAEVPDSHSRVLARYIRGYGVNIAICDKGLAYTSGIELIKSLRELEVQTVMITAEIETRETHRVADKYVEKGISPAESFYQAVYELIGFRE